MVLVGPDALPQGPDHAALKAQPNVHFAGRQPLSALPRYLKAFDVALLPYNLGGHTHSIYPLKLHEYLAAGRSVLATALPELRPFADAIRIAADAAEFIRLVPEALADNEPARQAERSALARGHTWEQRVSSVHQALDARLATRDRRATPSRDPLEPVKASG
jgi:glycosyltransferase involved in cell wall biosynthesis